ncbi:methyltransferase domain-containing protein [Actinocatenispora thailandica]|nr:methyltransferase domain-containing protein [Actinocatenispora thailandica]
MTQQPTAAEELSERIFTAGVAAAELAGVYLGVVLGLYRPLADPANLTCAELAACTGVDRRYAREWLQGQVISGFVTTSGPDLETATFSLPPGGRDVLVDELSPTYLAALAQFPAALGRAMPALVRAYRSGSGVPLDEYGADGVTAQAALNRPAYHNELAESWIAAIPDLAARLADRDHPARVADLGCGGGWAGISLAVRYPQITVDAYDADRTSVSFARRNAADSDVADRVVARVHDLAEPLPDETRYDLVMLLECVHDMAYPARVLATARNCLAPDGVVLVMDEATDDELIAPTDDPVQRFFGAISPIWCLPQGRSAPDADPVGTVIRASRMAELAAEAGFDRTEILPIENPFYRFYRMRA